MNRGLVIKAAHEVLPVTLIFGSLLMIFEGLLTFVLATFQKQFSEQLLQLPFVNNMVSAFIGAERRPGVALGPEMFAAVPWAHPVVLALLWGHAIVTCTRVPSGEVDRGTIDVLMGLPVSRRTLYVSDSLATLAGGAVVSAMALLGNLLANARLDPASRQPVERLMIAAVSLLALHLAGGGLGWFCSSLSNRRGRAMGAAFVVAVAWLLVNYIGQLWEPARNLVHLSPLHYHEPLAILRTGDWPVKDLAIMLGVAAAGWCAGGVIFARRDLMTV